MGRVLFMECGDGVEYVKSVDLLNEKGQWVILVSRSAVFPLLAEFKQQGHYLPCRTQRDRIGGVYLVYTISKPLESHDNRVDVHDVIPNQTAGRQCYTGV